MLQRSGHHIRIRCSTREGLTMHVAFSSVIPRATERVIGFWITVERSWCTVPFGICDARNTSNPTAGSFNINPMLTHWFATFAILGFTSLLTIYQTFLNGHFCSILLTRGRMPVRIPSKQPWVCTLYYPIPPTRRQPNSTMDSIFAKLANRKKLQPIGEFHCDFATLPSGWYISSSF